MCPWFARWVRSSTGGLAWSAALLAQVVLVAGPTAAVRPGPGFAAPGDAPVIAAMSVSPRDVVLPASTSTRRTTRFAVNVRVRDADGVDTVVVGVFAPGGTKGQAVRAVRVSGTEQDGRWRARISVGVRQPAGRWTVQAFATDLQAHTSDPDRVQAEYSVRTPTRFRAFDVVEPARPGEPVALAGRLERWAGKRGWIGFGRAFVAVEFRARGAKNFRVVERMATERSGEVPIPRASVAAAGEWRLTFSGTDVRAPSTSRIDEVALVPVEAPAAPKPAATATPSGAPKPAATATPSAPPTPTAAATPPISRRADPATSTPSPTPSGPARPRK